jgi:hypothetical protein
VSQAGSVTDPYQQWALDADLLAHIGRALFGQPTTIEVRLPRNLADQAVEQWQREGYEGDLPIETPEQRRARHHSGTLGLIGLSIEQNGRAEGDGVVVELDAWYVGDALEAADEAGLIGPVTPGQEGQA